MNAEELKKEIYVWKEYKKPPQWREGQYVFNYIDEIYGVAREAQFKYKVDCFYRDDKIDEFIETCANIITKLENEQSN